MKQIIPFNKDIAFKTMIGEIQSISLEHTLKIEEDNNIKGDFIVSGSYKMTEASTIAEEFSYKIPVDIYIDEQYNLEDATIDIDDFKYSIVNDDTLEVKIDVVLDHMQVIEPISDISTDEEVIRTHLDKEYLKRKEDLQDVTEQTQNEEEKEELLESKKEEETSMRNTSDKQINSEQIYTTKNEEMVDEIQIPIETSDTKEQEPVESLFSKFSDEEDSYATYKVYIVRENDNLESIMEKYNVSVDELREYNNIDDLKINDKLIIPSHNEHA